MIHFCILWSLRLIPVIIFFFVFVVFWFILLSWVAINCCYCKSVIPLRFHFFLLDQMLVLFINPSFIYSIFILIRLALKSFRSLFL
jgi:hypothetical protein